MGGSATCAEHATDPTGRRAGGFRTSRPPWPRPARTVRSPCGDAAAARRLVVVVKRACPTCDGRAGAGAARGGLAAAHGLHAGRSRVPRRGAAPSHDDRPRRSLAPRDRDRADAAACRSRRRESSAPSAGCARSGRRSPASPARRRAARDAAGVRLAVASIPISSTSCAVRFGAATLRARRVELAALEDEIEALFERGWTDGLPVVPPTEERVLRDARRARRARRTRSSPWCRPTWSTCTVEKVAINAVMAGCKPEYLPLVLAAVEAACTDEFNMHGLLATTMPVGPVLIVQRPGPPRDRHELGHQRVRSGQPRQPRRSAARCSSSCATSAVGGPARSTAPPSATPASSASASPRTRRARRGTPLSQSRRRAGHRRGDAVRRRRAALHRRSAVARPRVASPDRSPRACARCTTRSCVLGFDAILVRRPEHARVFAERAGTRADRCASCTRGSARPAAEIVRGAGGIAEGVPDGFGDRRRCPKFRPGGLLLVHAGGGAGLFSAIIGGWANGRPASPADHPRAVR